MTQTYVYEGDEVRLTGRVAQRARPGRRDTQVDELVEIQNTSQYDSTKRWVKRSDLYEISINTEDLT